MDEQEINDLKQHIQKQLDKGYAPDTIKSSLIFAGFPKSHVNKAFSALEKEQVQEPEKPAEEEKKSFFARLFAGRQEQPEEQETEEVQEIPEKQKKEKKTKKQKAEKKRKEPAEEKIHEESEEAEKEAVKRSFFARLFAGRQKQPEEQEAEELQEIPAEPKKEKKTKKQKKEEKIEEAHKELEETPAPRPKKPASRRRIWAFVFIILMFLVAIAAIIVLLLLPVSCATEQCFLDKANKCEQATYRNTIKGTALYYETNNCALTKTVTALDPEEPQEIVDAFLGKSMTCRYQMNNFNPIYLSTVSGLVNNCEGPLRAAILAYSI